MLIEIPGLLSAEEVEVAVATLLAYLNLKRLRLIGVRHLDPRCNDLMVNRDRPADGLTGGERLMA